MKLFFCKMPCYIVLPLYDAFSLSVSFSYILLDFAMSCFAYGWNLDTIPLCMDKKIPCWKFRLFPVQECQNNEQKGSYDLYLNAMLVLKVALDLFECLLCFLILRFWPAFSCWIQVGTDISWVDLVVLGLSNCSCFWATFATIYWWVALVTIS